MSNETQTTQPMSPEDLANQSKMRAEVLDAAPVEAVEYQPYPGPMEGAVFGGTAALDAAVEASNAAGSPDDQVVEPNNVIEPEPETPAPEPAPEREKVWNINLQAWV